MVTNLQNNQGTGSSTDFNRSQVQTIDMAAPATSLDQFQNSDTFFTWYEDFLKTNPSQSAPWATDYSASGSPTYDYVANGIGGQVQPTIAATNAAQFIGSGWDDNLQIDALRRWCSEARIQLPDDLATDEYALVGVSGAIKTGVNLATLGGFVGAAFKVDEDNQLICVIQDGDDTTTAYETGIILLDDTWYWLKVAYEQGGLVEFYYGPGLGEDGGLVYSEAVAWVAATKFQPISGIVKVSGVTTPSIINDTMKGFGNREVL